MTLYLENNFILYLNPWGSLLRCAINDCQTVFCSLYLNVPIVHQPNLLDYNSVIISVIFISFLHYDFSVSVQSYTARTRPVVLLNLFFICSVRGAHHQQLVYQNYYNIVY